MRSSISTKSLLSDRFLLSDRQSTAPSIAAATQASRPVAKHEKTHKARQTIYS